MNRIERIERMEAALRTSLVTVAKLIDAMDEYEKNKKTLKALFDYYGSTKWMQDYEADEAGLLPKDLERGVLSEDAVYDLLTEHRELMARLSRAVTFAVEENLL